MEQPITADDISRDLIHFIAKSPSTFHAVRGIKADIASLYSPSLSIFYFLFAFFARLLPINWMSWTTTMRTRMVATMTSAWKRW